MTSQTLEKPPFWAITIDEAQQLRKAKVLDATADLLAIVKAHGAAGWKWAVDVKDFCKQWDIKERTFYRALATLRSLKLVFWEKRDRNTISWRSANLDDTDDTTVTQNPDSSKAPPPFTGTLPQLTLPLPQVASFLPQLTLPLTRIATSLPLIAFKLPIMAKKPPKTIDIQRIEAPLKSISDLDQKNSNSTTTSSIEKVAVDGKDFFSKEKDPHWLTGIKARLREIRISPDAVSWTFSQFPKYVIEDALAYTAEQKWAFKPAAVYVTACREGKKPEAKSECVDQFSAPPEPDEETLSWLKELKAKRIIKDLYTQPWQGSKYRILSIDTGASIKPWWEVIDALKKEPLAKS